MGSHEVKGYLFNIFARLTNDLDKLLETWKTMNDNLSKFWTQSYIPMIVCLRKPTLTHLTQQNNNKI